MGKKSGSFFDMQFITSSISTMLVLLLLGMVVFFVLSANNLSKYVRENISFSVLISDDMKGADALKFQKKLNEEPFVKETSYISKEQALKEQSEAMGTDPAEFLGYNPFTASIEIKLNADYANSDSISWIEQKIMQNKKVMEINYPQDLLDAVNSNIRKISFLLLGLAALLTLISFALINNTVRLRIYSNRFLINTMKLVGAKSWFIRKPYIKQSVINGIIAAAIALGLMAALVYYFKFNFGVDMQIIKPVTALTVAGIVIVTGIVLTAISSYFAVGRYLRMRTDDMYYV